MADSSEEGGNNSTISSLYSEKPPSGEEENQPIQFGEEEKENSPIQFGEEERSSSLTPSSEAVRKAQEEEGAAGAGAAEAAEAAAEAKGEEEEFDPYMFLELGDQVVIESTKYGAPVAGTIYFRDGDLIRIKPIGSPDELIDFARDPDTDQFLPEENVTKTYIIKKRDYEAFVDQNDIRVGQLLSTVTNEKGAGPEFQVLAVDGMEDTITVKNTGSGDEHKITFGGIGIPREEPFSILHIKRGPPEAAPLGSAGAEEAAAAVRARALDSVEGEAKEEGEEAAGEEEDEDEEFEIEVVGVVTRPLVTTYREAKASEKRIPDAIQKIDALNDFLNMLDPREQKNPKALRAIRILVETLFNMKREITKTSSDGEIIGVNVISPLRLRDLLEMTDVPLGRAVLEIKKRLYKGSEKVLEGVEGGAGAGAGAGMETATMPIVTQAERDEDEDVYFRKEKDELAELAEEPEKRKMAAVSTYVVGEEKRNVAFYMEEQRSYDAFGRPWRAGNTKFTPFRPRRDTTIFRTELPEMKPEEASLYGYLPMETEETKREKIFKKSSTEYEKGIVETFPEIGKIRYGMERALTTTYRKSEKGARQVLVSAEEAPMSAYLLFPQAEAVSLGTTRSGSIALDSARSAAPRETMEMILEKHNGILPAPTIADIIPLKPDSDAETLGNFEVKDYVGQLDTPGLGLGDTYASLVEFGLDNVEMSQDVAEVLLQKVEKYQQQLIMVLNKLREEVGILAGAPVEPTLNNFLPDDAWSALEDYIRSDATLADDMKLFDTTALRYVKSDIAKVAFLVKKHNDLFQAVIGNNPVIVAQERTNAIRRAYRDNLEVAKILRLNELMRGVAPKPNKCEHVAMLATIRAVPDESERFYALTKFFTKYQGKRSTDDNWIHCNLCERELMCVHERLQIQAFLTPSEAERETIQKEMYIKFSGGVFQGAYICRHCGQPMREIALDTHLQFDDEGRPMMGRAELVDKDALRQEELDQALGLDQMLEADVEFANEEQRMYYNVLRELADRAGIPVPKNHYKELVAMFAEVVSAFPKPDVYKKMAEDRAAESGGKIRLPEYSTAVARTLVRNAAALLLVDAQTAIPEYVFRQTIPRTPPTFVGYPYNEDLADTRAIKYMAIVVDSIKKPKVSPWKEMDFKATPATATKQKTRLMVIEDSINGAVLAMIKDSSIAALLTDRLNAKRAYIAKKFSTEGVAQIPTDQIPSTFLPKQVVLTGAAAAASAEGAVVPEAVAATGKEEAVVGAWIQQGHAAARETAPLVIGSPYAEITCCKSNITAPGYFWRSLTRLPPLPLRQLGVARQPTIFQPEFRPRPLEHLTATVPPDLTYRLFLKVCFTGPRVGELHEPGLTNVCAWCGFQFPGHPAVMDDAEGKAALQGQGIDTDMPAFTELLNKTHSNNTVPPFPMPPSPGLEATLNHLLQLDPPPTPVWQEMVTALVAAVQEVGKENQQSLLVPMGPISTWNTDAEATLLARLKGSAQIKKTNIIVLQEIRKLSWSNFCEVLQAYFLVICQQILSGFNIDSVFLPNELKKELSQTHAQQIERDILARNYLILKEVAPPFKKPDMAFARAKLIDFVAQIRAIYAVKNKIRPIYFPGQELTFRELQSMMFLGPLLNLLDERVIPSSYGAMVAEGGAGAGAGAGSQSITSFPMDSLYMLLNETFTKYQKERLGYNDEELRQKLNVRHELEKERLLTDLRKMSQEERRIEMITMRLGIGKYAVGGTSAIYKYSKDQYDVEQQEMKEAGIHVFSEYEANEMREERENGYDMEGGGGGDDE